MIFSVWKGQQCTGSSIKRLLDLIGKDWCQIWSNSSEEDIWKTLMSNHLPNTKQVLWRSMFKTETMVAQGYSTFEKQLLRYFPCYLQQEVNCKIRPHNLRNVSRAELSKVFHGGFRLSTFKRWFSLLCRIEDCITSGRQSNGAHLPWLESSSAWVNQEHLEPKH